MVDMSQPNPEGERADFFYKLHIDAGLVPSGKNEDGEQEWIGTDEKWNLYEEMANAQE